MNIYTRAPFYYETDQMGIIHHSNYIRYMEEARLDLLNQLGVDYFKLEARGFISPVTKISCEYRLMATVQNTVSVKISVTRYTGILFELKYEIFDPGKETVFAVGTSQHCILDKESKRIQRIPETAPKLDRMIQAFAESGYETEVLGDA